MTPRPTGRPAIAPTWWLLVELDLPGLTGLRAIGPLSWTAVRKLGGRWERAFGIGTTAFTERPGPVPRRVEVGARPPPAVQHHTGAVPAVRASRRPEPVSVAPVAPRAPRSSPQPRTTTPPTRPATQSRAVPAPRPRSRPSGPSQLSSRARAAMTRTRAARTAIDASVAGLEAP